MMPGDSRMVARPQLLQKMQTLRLAFGKDFDPLAIAGLPPV